MALAILGVVYPIDLSNAATPPRVLADQHDRYGREHRSLRETAKYLPWRVWRCRKTLTAAAFFSPWWQVHVLNCPCQWVCLDHFPEPGYTIIKVCILLKIPLPLAPSNQATRKSSVIHDWVGVGECTWMWICAFVCSCSSRRCSNLQLTSLSQCNVVNPRIGSSQLRVE